MTSDRSSIILTGFRATGKSSVGKALADRLGFRFLDMDKEIEARQGRSISDMVAANGWPYFRALEATLLEELAGRPGLVVASGGGAIQHREAWSRLKEEALVVWLTADLATIAARLATDSATAGQRPSLTGKDIIDEIGPLLKERTPLYEQGSHISIDTNELGPDDIVALVLRARAERKSTNP